MSAAPGLALSLLLGACAPAPPIKVVTYNIHGGADILGRDRLAEIGAVLREQRPDVVLLQEVLRRSPRAGFRDQFAELLAASGLRYGRFQKLVGPEPFGTFGERPGWWDGGEVGQAIFSDRLFEPRSARYMLPYVGGWYLGSAYVVADFGDAVVVGTHLNFDQFGYREEEARRLVAMLAREGRPVILGGDLNATLGSETMDVFAAARLAAAPATASDIDHLLVRGAVVQTCETLAVDYSDHRPRVFIVEKRR